MKNKIIEILEHFKREDINYSYLRDQQSFENIFLIEGSDIDLLIDQKEINKVKYILETHDFFTIFNHKIFLNLEENIFFDIHKEVYERYPQLNINRALKGRVNKEFYFLSTLDLYKILLIHPMDLTGFRGKRSYTQDKIDYFNNNKVNITVIENELRLEFGNKFTTKLMENIQNNNFERIKKDNLYYKILMYWYKPSYLSYLFKRLLKKIMKKNYEKSKLIIYMGVDGSGKTTIAKNTIEFMNRYYSDNSNKIYYYYLGSQGGYILPMVQMAKVKDNIKSFFFKKIIQKFDKVDKIKLNLFRHAKSKEFLLIFEYIIRYLKLQYLLKIRNKIIISDRYLYDYFRTDNTDPQVVRFFAKFFPKPDYIFMLYGDTQKFYDRKKEYSSEILKMHQDDLLNGLKKSNMNFHRIDANQNKDDIMRDILKILSD